MAEELQKKSEKVRQPTKRSIYNEFILWSAMPALEQRNLGIETQEQFSEYYKVHRDTLTDWKQRVDYEDRVDAILKTWSIGKTPDVVHGIYRAAVKGNPMSQLLWLQYFKKFSPKTEVEHSKKVEISVNDIRFLIEAMPEQYKEKFYGYIREIIDTAHALRNARQLDDRPLPNEDTEAAVLREADSNASNAPGQNKDVVASRDQGSIRKDMGGEAHPYNNQSTPRRWQE